MKVAHIITRLILGGAQENTLLNCRDLQQQFGDKVLLLTGPPLGPEGSLLEQAREASLKIQIVPELRRAIHPLRDWQSYQQIQRAIRAFQPDVVHTHSAKAGILGRFAASRLRVPAIVHTVHGAPWYPEQGRGAQRLIRWAEWWAARHCHALIGVAEAMTELIVSARIAPANQCVTIFSGMETAPFLNSAAQRAETRRALGYTQDHVVIGKIARLFHLKGHADVLQAAAQVVAIQPQARFLFLGDGLLRAELERQAAALHLQDHVRFQGLVPSSEIPRYLSAIDLVVHASLREGLARALPQALLSGVPVVSVDRDGAREVVIPDRTGELVAPHDSLGLSRALQTLIADPALRARYGTNGRELCRQRFDHLEMTRQIRALYEQILQGSCAQRGTTSPPTWDSASQNTSPK